MKEPLVDDGLIRKLWIAETARYRDHLLRLDASSRHNRFGAGVSDDFIRNYVKTTFGLGAVVHGYFSEGILRGAAELRPLGPAYQLVIVAGLGTWALVVNGTFFAAMSLRTRAREIMLPLLLFPILIPALLGMVEATTAILTGEYSAKFWIALLVAYDVVFTIGSLMLFELVLHAE